MADGLQWHLWLKSDDRGGCWRRVQGGCGFGSTEPQEDDGGGLAVKAEIKAL